MDVCTYLATVAKVTYIATMYFNQKVNIMNSKSHNYYAINQPKFKPPIF